MSVHRIITGQGPCPSGAPLSLALVIAQAGRRLGFRVGAVRRSHNPASDSRYIWLHDRGGREWLVRIAGHHMPICNRQPVPNLNLVSLDGASGLTQAISFLERAIAGSADWHDPRDIGVRQGLKERRRQNRRRRKART